MPCSQAKDRLRCAATKAWGLSDKPLILQRKVWVRELQALADGKPLTQWTRSERLAGLLYSMSPRRPRHTQETRCAALEVDWLDANALPVEIASMTY
jgi:hypothetical protein